MAGCGGGSNNVTGMIDSTPPEPTVPEPQAQAVMMDLELSAAQRLRLLLALPDAGTSDTVTIAAGATETRMGVVFTCDSAYPCTVTVTNSLDTINASWSSMMLPDGMANVMAHIPMLPDPLRELNDANAVSVASILNLPINDGTTVPPGSAYGNASTTIGGLGLEAIGAENIDMVTLTSGLDPNSGAHVPDMIDATSGARTPPSPAMPGSTVSAAVDIAEMNADTVAPDDDDWSHKVLFRDWGDTVGTGDGGFETGALIYSNMEAPTMAPFDGMLGPMFANPWVANWFTFDADTNATPATFEAVTIEPAAAGWVTPAQTIMISVEGSQAAAVQINIPTVLPADRNTANEYRGTYFGAAGTFACVDATMGSCVIERAMTGETGFQLADMDPNTAGFQTAGQANWEFTPDPDAMVTVPDQDWFVYGAWATTPDVPVGSHRVGVFFEGMNEYNYGDGTALTGTATYNGGAAGVYRDGTNSGLFTARATLMASFTPNTLAGRIDDFRNTAGVFLGQDTAADPNDPVAGGENDWVVLLNSTSIDTDGTLTTPGTVAGSADGVPWETGGTWTAQLYCPGNGTAATPPTDQPLPSGVAGQFRAFSGRTPDNGNLVNPTRAVVGSFGAQIESN
jgi:hypothetical protein